VNWKWNKIAEWVKGVENRMGNMQVGLSLVHDTQKDAEAGRISYAYVQVRGMSRDLTRPTDNAYISWTGRKWLISQHMTETEVVNTCYLALVQAMMHELQEAVHYKGQRVFDPHIAVWHRMENNASDVIPQDVRENSINGA
jgi:hypothetical protein